MSHRNWHNADIIAALKKRGTSLAALSREVGLSSSTLANALTRPWPKGESIIAQALNTSPEKIWPNRYVDKDGNSILRKIRAAREETSSST
ncbi:helix-turn-helix domain-containing protein [Scandinavium goeteborgense]|uniref:helix-turn-helix domain-containing protein n=1 Tax=Scandinavium goeteborgense TaxID=1851514 RepID=UPI00380A1C44